MKRLPRTWFDPEGRLSGRGLQWIEAHPGAVLLESNSTRRGEEESLLFLEPTAVIQAARLDDVEGSLLLLDSAIKDGYYAAGFLSYEAGYAFENTLPRPPTPDVPFLWFGVYSAPLNVPRKAPAASVRSREKRPSVPSSGTPEFTATVSEDEYFNAVGTIREYIAAGDTYQVNYTFRLRFLSLESLTALYQRLRRMQSVPYSAFLNTGSHTILSLSPELFFRREGVKVLLRPMKGTAQRGRTLPEDEEFRSWLEQSEKNRAENLMIVDLLRNDLGKLARPGSVRVKKFFDIERYETVFQATSTIEGLLRNDVTDGDIIRSFFPSGSVTGAPKIRTMQIIHELEREPRGLYTGAIGYISPRRKAVFNVAIRTVVVDQKTRQAEYGVGSGIVHDSGTQDEYNECLLKAKFLHENPDEFALVETIRWDPAKRWSHLQLHLRRLKSSAEYFGFPFSRQSFLAAVRKLEKALALKRRPMRVRLLLERNGSIRTDVAPLEELKDPVLIGLSATAVNPADRFLYHKTTNRNLYDTALEIAERNGLFDMIFRNQQGEITEGARSNIVLRIDQQFVTPPLTSGVLAGTYREYLIRSKKWRLTEKILYPDDILSADEIFVCNALRGLVKVRHSEKEITV